MGLGGFGFGGGGGGGGTVGPGTIGRVAKFTAANAVVNSSVNDTGDYATQRIGLGIGNLVGGPFTAVKSSAVGYGNYIGQTANANNATAIGYANEINNATSAYAVGGSTAVGAKNKIGTAAHAAYKSSAFGDYNHIGQLRTATYSTAVGYSNYVDSINASAFGNSNRIGSAANACRFSTVLGSSNVIGNYAAALRATASGYANHVDNADDSNAFGTRNILGSGSYTALKSSAIGYANQIGQTANADKSNAFGLSNTINNALYGCAVGAKNIIGYGGTSSPLSLAVGYNNKIGAIQGIAIGVSNRVQGTYGLAVGINNHVDYPYGVTVGFGCYTGASNSNAFGFKAISRIPKTTNICGPQIIRKDNGEAANIAFESFSGVCGLELSKEVDLTSIADQTITIPNGASIWIDEVGLICTALDGSLTLQPQIHAGITGSTQKYLANVLTTALTAAKKRARYNNLLADDGEASIVLGVAVAAVLNTATVYKGRFYVKWSLIEDE